MSDLAQGGLTARFPKMILEEYQDFVKVNFAFPPEALRVNNIRFDSIDTGLIYIEISKEELIANFSKIENYHGYNPFQQFEDSIRPTGKAFFFRVKSKSTGNKLGLFDCCVSGK